MHMISYSFQRKSVTNERSDLSRFTTVRKTTWNMFLQGQIVEINAKRIDVRIPILQAVIAMPLFRDRTYTSEHIEEHHLLLTENMISENILQQVQGKQLNMAPKCATYSTHQIKDKKVIAICDGAQQEGYMAEKSKSRNIWIVHIPALDEEVEIATTRIRKAYESQQILLQQVCT